MNTDKNAFDYYMAEVERIPMLSAEEEKAVAQEAWAGNSFAVNKLVRANLRFVVQTAWKYKGRGVDLEDLIAVGNEGLITAAEKFDPSKNTKFITYAIWWIKLAINKELYGQGRDVKIPVGKSQELASSKWRMTSLDKSVDEDSGCTMGDMLVDSRNGSPEENLMVTELMEDLDCALNRLNDLEKQVIQLRFGIESDEPMSLNEVGSLTGYSKERIRQIELKAVKKMRIRMTCCGYAA